MPVTQRFLVPCLLALLVVLAVASLAIGPAQLGAGAMWLGLVDGKGFAGLILREIRLPRTVLALVAGGGLGLAGAALQGLLRNPLAEPAIFGAPQAAALGAVLVLFVAGGAPGSLAVGAAAVGGALLALALLVAIAGRSESLTAFLLAGLAIGSLAGALTTLVLNLAPNPFALAEIVYWMMGSFENTALPQVAIAGACILVGGALLFTAGPSLRALALGEEVAESLGTRLGAVRLAIVAGVGLIVGGTTAAAGAIGFVGLVAPHLVRRACGYDPARLLLPAALAGACLLTAADIAVRLIPANTELKVGVLTSLIGVPVFLWILIGGYRAREGAR